MTLDNDMNEMIEGSSADRDVQTPDFESMSVEELQNHIKRAQAALVKAKTEARARVQRHIASVAESAGFSISELFGPLAQKRVVAIKYQNPANRFQTWTGRGRRPSWLVTELNKGARLQDFAA